MTLSQHNHRINKLVNIFISIVSFILISFYVSSIYLIILDQKNNLLQYSQKSEELKSNIKKIKKEIYSKQKENSILQTKTIKNKLEKKEILLLKGDLREIFQAYSEKYDFFKIHSINIDKVDKNLLEVEMSLDAKNDIKSTMNFKKYTKTRILVIASFLNEYKALFSIKGSVSFDNEKIRFFVKRKRNEKK